MADKQVDIVCTEDSVTIGDTAGNKATVTGNKLDCNATIAAGGVVTAKIQDSAGNALTSTGNKLDVEQRALAVGTDAVKAQVHDGAGNALTSTGNKLDVNQNALAHGTDSVTARTQDGSGNALASTGGRLHVSQNALAAGTDAVKAQVADGSGTAITSVTDGAAQRLHVATQATIEAAEGPNFPRREIVRTAVQVGDVGVDYVAGSPGQVKTEKMYPQGAAPGSPAKLTTYKYQDGTYPTFCTFMSETATTV